MIAWLQLVLAACGVLVLAYVPGMIALRLLGTPRLSAWALAPALAAAGAGIGAIAAEAAGVRWDLVTAALGMVLGVIGALVLRRLGLRVPPERERPLPLLAGVPGAPWWLLGALVAAIAPILLAFGRADGILERWDTLYHLNSLARVRETGQGSSLTFGVIASTTGRTAPYPAAFHDLVALVPGVPTPILLNGGTLALAVVPWAVGIAILARVIWPRVEWAPCAAAIVALLAPATPVDLWIHLSPIPNLTGMAMLPGVLAAAVPTWRAVLRRAGRESGSTAGGGIAARRAPDGGRRGIVLMLGILAAAGVGLALQHPNCAVTALILLAVLTAATGAARMRERPLLAVIPVLLLVPVALLTWTPLAAMVTGFVGGWAVPWWRGIGEALLGLLTVWPMPIGVVIAAVWWPGIVRAWRTPQRWVGIAWIVIAVIYVDAAVDSPLGLSVLYYRGQDRVAMPFMMLCCLLVVPGLQAWGALLRGRGDRGRGDRGRDRVGAPALVAAALVLAVVVGAVSVPAKLDHARQNAALEYPGRPRFLQADELAAFARVDGRLDHTGQMLASPFSGAAHLFAITGQNVRFPVAGMTLSPQDRAVLNAVRDAGTDPRACRVLQDAGIRYVYQERTPYAADPWYIRINRGGDGLGPVLFTTDHSRLIQVDCRAG